MHYSTISLFSGAMGLDLGLEAAGLDISISQDFDSWCVKTIEKNGKKGLLGDIRDLLETDPTAQFLLDAAGLERSGVFAVVGGPPCQAYSTAGRRKGVLDDRGDLYNQFIQVVDQIRPRFFIMENVKGLVSMFEDPGNKASRPLLDIILEKFSKLGYSIVTGMVDAVNYGAPQYRERLVIIGSRDNEDIFLPLPSHFQKHQDKNYRWKTLGEAIGNIEDAGPSAKFTPNILKYLRLVPEGGNWKSLDESLREAAMGGAYLSGGGKVGFYRRLSFSEPSPTLVTSPIQKATILCHPLFDRPLSVREYARIQGFPDKWEFVGDTSESYRQIGNAVPIPLGQALGQMLVSVANQSSSVFSKRRRGTATHRYVYDEIQPQFVYQGKPTRALILK